ncbi:hypothetical protein HPB51_001759 [Rhipicephalus microplus]|uniref:CCHC-type domain-containing protein n=1 Tax=Rhipicephalus microplus TaxID=6941 RepID=A0A9J6EQX3_RHIMP|nr:hypothetical protein HPB51_001759 [Rhipicephalus microplus]
MNTSNFRIYQALTISVGRSSADVTEDIICPIAMQNFVVISAPSQANAKAYASVEAITIIPQGTRLAYTLLHETPNARASPETSIRTLTMKISEDQSRNPSVLEERRIKNSATVVILFRGLRVPKCVMCCPSIVKCTLYRWQMEVCYACGRLGHRADVFHTP